MQLLLIILIIRFHTYYNNTAVNKNLEFFRPFSPCFGPDNLLLLPIVGTYFCLSQHLRRRIEKRYIIRQQQSFGEGPFFIGDVAIIIVLCSRAWNWIFYSVFFCCYSLEKFRAHENTSWWVVSVWCMSTTDCRLAHPSLSHLPSGTPLNLAGCSSFLWGAVSL